MSLTVPTSLLQQAQDGEIATADFLCCISTSLPYAWNLVEGLVERLKSDEAVFVDNQVPPPDEAARGQLLRLLASDAMRVTVEQHFGVKLAFQNCHRVAVFGPECPDSTYQEFITPRSQILNQSPELIDC